MICRQVLQGNLVLPAVKQITCTIIAMLIQSKSWVVLITATQSWGAFHKTLETFSDPRVIFHLPFSINKIVIAFVTNLMAQDISQILLLHSMLSRRDY